MTFLLLIPTILAFLCLAAHFLHHGKTLLAVASVLMPLLLQLRQRFILRAFQGLLVMACVEWLLSLPEVIAIKRGMNEPFMIDIYILGGVALFNLFAALLFQTPRLKARYCAPVRSGGPPVASEPPKPPDVPPPL